MGHIRAGDLEAIPIKTTLILSVCVFWDLETGHPLTAVVAAGALLYLAPRAWIAARRPRGPLRTRQLFAPALALALLAGSLGLAVGQARWAEARADELIAALDRFHAAEGRWPRHLQELTPGYLDEVPVAYPFRGMRPHFGYSLHQRAGQAGQGAPHLRWVVVAPFGRKFFSFCDRSWGVTD